MTFEPKKVKEFIKIFNASKEHIRNFEGCMYLELLYDVNTPNVFFTYSHWKSENDLGNYRNSELFKNVWSKTKALFSIKAEAWSLVRNEILK